MSERILLVIHSLQAGGAERVLSRLASHWANSGRQVRLLTLDDGTLPPFYPLAAGIEHVPLALAGPSRGVTHAVARNVRRVRALRRQMIAFDAQAAVSFMVTGNLLTLAAARGLRVPVVISERVDPLRFPIGRARRSARALLYPWATRIVVQTAAARERLPAAARGRATVIPNPVEVSAGHAAFDRPPREGAARRLMAMGRLTEQKGFDLLLEAFGRVAERFPDWNLYVWGEGEERGRLEQLRQHLGLERRVHLPGITPHPAEEMRGADLFVLSSRYEGFPNVLCEAMACGLPVITTDCPSGPRDIVRDGVDGLLVPPDDTESLARALARLMADEAERRRLARRGVEVIERFAPRRVWAQWDELVDGLAR